MTPLLVGRFHLCRQFMPFPAILSQSLRATTGSHSWLEKPNHCYQANIHDDVITEGPPDGTEESSFRPELRQQYEATPRGSVDSSDVIETGINDRQRDTRVRRRRPPTFPAHGGEYAKVVAIIYAILLTVIGFLLSLAEALSNTWLGTSTNAAFIAYMLIAGTGYLVFLQFYLLRLPTSPSRHHSNARSVEFFSKPITDCFRSCLKWRQTKPKENAIANTAATSFESMEIPITSSSYDNDMQLTVTSLRAIIGRQAQMYGSSSGNASQRSVTIFTSMSEGQNERHQPSIYRPSGTVQRHVTSARSRRPSELLFASNAAEQLPDGSVTDDDDLMFWLDLNQLGDLFSHKGTSLYLRLGALIFGVGNVIECGVEIQNWLSPDPRCSLLHYDYGWTFVLQLIFIVAQTFVLFKGTPVKIVCFQSLAEFGFLHLIATNLCLWLQTLIREITLMFDSGVHTMSANSHVSIYNYTAKNSNDTCDGALLLTVTVYLYPFVLEYSLIAIGAIGSILYNGVGKGCRDDNEHMAMGFKNLIRVFKYGIKVDQEDDPEERRTRDVEHTDHGGGHTRDATFAKSHTGLFTGILLLAIVITSVVLSYFNMYSSKEDIATLIFNITDMVLHGLLLVACVIALFLTNRLSYIDRPISIDDFLLFLSMSGCLAFELTVLIASVAAISADDPRHSPLELSSSILAASQTILQTILILFAMRRFPSTTSDVINMPGRGTFAFLIVANIAAWIERTMQVRQYNFRSLEGHFYGSVGWLLLSDINLPLLLFYRFHSSVCFADIWHVAYTPLRRDVIKRHSRSKPHVPPTTSSTAVASMAPVPRIMITVPTPTMDLGDWTSVNNDFHPDATGSAEPSQVFPQQHTMNDELLASRQQTADRQLVEPVTASVSAA